MTVEMDTSGMVAGDTAGLALLSSPYAWIGVVKSDEGATLQMYSSPRRGRRFRRRSDPQPADEPAVRPTTPPEHLWLRVHCNFDNDRAVFSWSADGKEFTPLGSPFIMMFQQYTLDTKGEKAIDLEVTYWGGDDGRTFDILVGNKRIATQTLRREQPNDFIAKRYPIPEESLKDAPEGRITIRFVATRWLAGGLFDLRLMCRNDEAR